MKTIGIRLYLIGFVFCFLPFTAFSQKPLTMATGVQPFGSFDGSPDVINLGDLNVHWSFPVAHKTGRGINFDYSLSYDSGTWINGGSGSEWSPIGGGWTGIGPAGGGGSLSYSETLWGGNGCLAGGSNYPEGLEDYNYVYVDSLGSPHWFGSGAYTQQCYSAGDYQNGPPTTNGFPATATDGSGIKLLCNGCTAGSTQGFTVVLPSGQNIAIGQSISGVSSVSNNYIEDSNGNYLNWNGGVAFAGLSAGYTGELGGNYAPVAGLPAYTDTLGSPVMTTTAEGYWDEYNSPPGNPGPGSWASYQPDGRQDGTGNMSDSNITMSVLGSSYTITNSPFEVKTSFGCPNVTEYDSGPVGVIWTSTYDWTWGTYNFQNLVTNLRMQDGSSYSLSYQPTQSGSSTVTGMLSSVVYPHGGSISYHYGPINCADGTFLSLTRTVNDGNGHSFTWTYQRSYLSASSQWQTVVTDPYGNQTVHLFVIGNTGAIPAEDVGDLYVPAASQGTNNFYQVSKVVYSGSASNGVILQTTNTCYNGNTTGAYSASCTTPLPFTYPITSIQTAVTPNGGALTGATVQLFNGIGLPAESDVYDYGTTNGQVGALLSRTTTTYATAGQILNKPASITQYDGAGNVISSTMYAYDETQAISTDGRGIANHTNYLQNGVMSYTTIANSSRGNPTTVTQGTGSTTLTKHYTYYDTGQVATSTDVNGATVTNNYSQCGGSLLSGTTQTVQPSGITLYTSQSWNCDGGVVVSETDINGNTTTTNYVDPFWRPTITVDPLGNTTHITYPTASSNNSTVSKTYAGSLPASSSFTTYDGLGRKILTQVQQGPGSSTYSSSAQFYDPFGHVAWSSAPYSAPAGSYVTTGPGTNAVYDALGRPQVVTDTGGGTLSYTYNLNDTLITQGPIASGENTKSRQLEYNLAGQLTSVCEITYSTASGPCGQSSSSTGYLTAYKYSGGLLKSVSQNVQAGLSATQTRSISYDVLGRKIAETIPETGTSRFFYDTSSQCGSSTGDMVESIDNAGNTICMGYDNLHRMTSSQVVSGPYAPVTPQTTYVYDAATVNGSPMQNALGTLAAVHTALCDTNACPSTNIFQNRYFEISGGQKTGRIISQLWESTPDSDGYVLTQSTTNANGTTAALSVSLNGASVGFPNMTYGLDALGRPATATDTTNNISLVTGTTYNNTTGAVTALTYGNGDFDQFGFDPNTGRPTSFAYSIGGPSSFAVSGGLTWNPNGSLQNFQMTDSSDTTKNQNCNYQMDDINRLASLNCAGSWAQNFSYDPFGNINKFAPPGATPNQYTQSYMAGYNSINNQVVSGANAMYDANGNQTLAELNLLSWNASAQPITVNGVGAMYDGLGRVAETDSTNIPAGTDTGSTGSIAIGGTEQMIPALEAYQATGAVILRGTEQSMPINLQTTSPNGCEPVVTDTPEDATCYDVGGGTLAIITVQSSDGMPLSYSYFGYSYGPGDTAATIGVRLAAEINADTAAGFKATPNPIPNAPVDVIVLQLQSTSSSPVVYYVESGYGCGGGFPNCSFSLQTPGELTPYGSGSPTPPIYDSGTVSASINNGPVVSYAWGANDTAVSIATSLAAELNQVYGASGTNIVNVSVPAGGSTIQLTSTGIGPTTNYPVVTSETFNSSIWGSPSFTSTAAGMSGGFYSATGTTAGTAQYVYSPSGAKIAVLQGGQLVKGIVPLPGGGTAIYNASGLDYFRHKDWLGSSLLATKWDHSVYSKEAYAPFGEPESNMEAGTPDRSFTGQDQDTTSGIFDYLFRRYDPVAGRWLSPDPSGWSAVSTANPQSLNRYAYVQNNPMGLTDPNGLDCFNNDGSQSAPGGCTGWGADSNTPPVGPIYDYPETDEEQMESMCGLECLYNAYAKQQMDDFWKTSAFRPNDPARIIMIGGTKYDTPLQLPPSAICPSGCYFEGTTYNYEVVSNAGNPINGPIAVSEVLDNLTGLQMNGGVAGGWYTENGFMQPDYVGAFAVSPTSFSQNILSITNQSFVVDVQGPQGGSFTLSTQILQTVTSTSNGSVSGSSLILFP